MWSQITKEIQIQSGITFELNETRKIHGGDISQSYLIQGSNQTYFVKINKRNNLALLEEERFSLSHLKNSQTINTPRVICVGSSLNASFLVLEYLTLTNGSSENWHDMGVTIAKLHRHTKNPMYGWDRDNFIGLTIQPNRWQKHWSKFFSEQRIGYQLQLLKEKGVSIASIRNIIDACNEMLANHNPQPCLLHGDLWSGNLAFSPAPTVYDPACYFGDRETDIAMTELFGRLPDEFYQGYNSIDPLPTTYVNRKELYNLYHLLNHANMFGGLYIEQCRTQIHKLFF